LASRCLPAACPQTSSRVEIYRRVPLDPGPAGPHSMRRRRLSRAWREALFRGPSSVIGSSGHRAFDRKEALVMVRNAEEELPGRLGVGRWLFSHDSEGRHGHPAAACLADYVTLRDYAGGGWERHRPSSRRSDCTPRQNRAATYDKARKKPILADDCQPKTFARPLMLIASKSSPARHRSSAPVP
jgi:hypothetical protein